MLAVTVSPKSAHLIMNKKQSSQALKPQTAHLLKERFNKVTMIPCALGCRRGQNHLLVLKCQLLFTGALK